MYRIKVEKIFQCNGKRLAAVWVGESFSIMDEWELMALQKAERKEFLDRLYDSYKN